jgi:hypothetical protein
MYDSENRVAGLKISGQQSYDMVPTSKKGF